MIFKKSTYVNIIKTILVIILFFPFYHCFSQGGVSINSSATPADPSAEVDIQSFDKGLLIPRMTAAQRNAIVSPAQALQIYNITTKCFEFWENGTWNTIVCANGCQPPSQPAAGANAPSVSQIIWSWNTVSGATGYKYNTINNYSSATDNGTNTSYTQTGLNCNTAYPLYVWAYNTCGYSSESLLNETTNSCPVICNSSLTDPRDAQTYSVIQIGSQCWMGQNLNYGTFVILSNGQGGTGTQKYCYNDNSSNCNIYGGLYTWPEIMNGASGCNGTGASQPQCTVLVQGICPTGWHIPSHYEWTLLEKNIGSDPNAFFYNDTTHSLYYGIDEGGNLKESGLTHWTSPNVGATNSTNFTAIGSGYSLSGLFDGLHLNAYFWTSTAFNLNNSWARRLNNDKSGIKRDYYDVTTGFSVRCIKD